jgi:hypothetical protein
VRVPELTKTTVLRLYISAPDAIPPAFTTNGAVWADGYRAVWHMDDGTGDTNILDSTANRFVGVKKAAGAPAEADAVVGKGQLFASNNINLTGLKDPSTTHTVSMWIKGSSLAANQFVFDVASGRFLIGWSTDTTAGKIGLYRTAWGIFGNTPSLNVWHHIAVCCGGTEARMYVDGVQYGPQVGYSGVGIDGQVMLGSRYAVSGSNWYYFPGLLDEVRLSSVLRSPDWIAATYSNMVPDSAFIAYNHVMPTPGPSLQIVSRPPDYGVADPVYGLHEGREEGHSYTCSVSQVWDDVAAGFRYNCTGWKRYGIDRGTFEETLLDEGATNELVYTHTDLERLEWCFAREGVRVVTSATEGGSVDVAPESESGFYATNSTVTITATPDAGYAFWKWTGDVPAAQQFDNPLVLNVGETPRAIAVVYSSALYVTPNGAGTMTGESWGNAFAGLQPALDAAKTAGVIATIKMKSGDYPLSQEIFVTDIANRVVIRGGYTGTGDQRTDERAVIYRSIDGDMRLFRAASSALTFENLAFTNGCFATANGNGFALHLTKCQIVMKNCAVRENGGSLAQGSYCGSIYLTGDATTRGSFEAYDCDISDNVFNSYFYSSAVYGVGIYSTWTSVKLANCTVNRNRAQVMYLPNQGIGAYVINANLDISNCTFIGNYCNRALNYSHNDAYGGALFVYHGQNMTTTWTISETLFEGNWLNDSGAPGGCLYIATGGSANNKIQASISRCVFRNNGLRDASDPMAIARLSGGATGASCDRGDVYISIGSSQKIGISNCVVVGAAHQDAFKIASGTVEFFRTTIAGTAEGYGLRVLGGKAMMKDSIIWGNASGGVKTDGTGIFEATYSDLQDGNAGLGNTRIDPLLDDEGWGHLKSEAGYYSDGGFTGGVWRISATTSPVIDVGDASGNVALEPQPNGHRPNLGGYAGTEVASKSKLGSSPIVTDNELKVFAYEVTPGVGCGTIRGVVASTGGGDNPTVYVVWDSTDCGTTSVTNWAHSQEIGTFAPWTIFTSTMANVAGSVVCRLVAENGEGTAFSDPAIEFQPASRATVSDAGIIRVQRTTAYAKATLSDLGRVETVLLVKVYPASGSADDAVVFDFNYGLPVAADMEYGVAITGLDPNVQYVFDIEAVNAAGTTLVTITKPTMTLAPRTFYVTPTGAGDQDGTSPESAFASLQNALDAAFVVGDIVMLGAGVYKSEQMHKPLDLSYVTASGLGGVTVKGDPAGGTVFTINVNQKRILHLASSTATFEDITFTGGRLNPANSYGHGVYAENSTVTFNRCKFIDNGETSGTGDVHRGGGFAALNGSARFVDCEFDKNKINYNNGDTSQLGGAIWTKDAVLETLNCSFTTNYLSVIHYGSRGGAIYATGGSAVISNCVFVGNYTTHSRGYEAQTSRAAMGGALNLESVPSATIVDCLFDGNFANALRSTYRTKQAGGTIRLAGATGKTVIDRCRFLNGGVSGRSSDTKNDVGSVTVAGGSAAMMNAFFYNTHSNAIEVVSGTLGVTNVTIVASMGDVAIDHVGGTLDIVNTIVWDNLDGIRSTASTLTVSHSDIQGGAILPGARNICADPKFRNPEEGNYDLIGGSPAKDKGLKAPWMKTAKDILGRRRSCNGVDMGAFESDAAVGFMMLVQ